MKKIVCVLYFLFITLVLLSGCALNDSVCSEDVSDAVSDETSFVSMEETSVPQPFPEEKPIPIPDDPQAVLLMKAFYTKDGSGFIREDYPNKTEYYITTPYGPERTFALWGMEFTVGHCYTRLYPYTDIKVQWYMTAFDSKIAANVGFDEERDRLVYLAYFNTASDVAYLERELDMDELSAHCKAFVEEQTKMTGWVEFENMREEPNSEGEKAAFQYGLYKNGICVSWADIKSVDKCGNIRQFNFIPVGDGLNVNVPDWPEEVYFEAIEKKLNTIFADCEQVAEVKDIRIDNPCLNYIRAKDSRAITHTVYYTLVYTDGTEDSFQTLVAVLYDE